MSKLIGKMVKLASVGRAALVSSKAQVRKQADWVTDVLMGGM